MTWTFLPIASRRFITADVDLTTERHRRLGLDETDAIAAALDQPLQDSVIRIRYRATEEQARRIEWSAIKGFLEEAGVHRMYAVQSEIVQADRVRVDGVDETLAPREALGAWCDANEIADPARTDLHALTDGYLEQARA